MILKSNFSPYKKGDSLQPPKNKYIEKNHSLFFIHSYPISPVLQAEDEGKPCKLNDKMYHYPLLLDKTEKYPSNLAFKKCLLYLNGGYEKDHKTKEI